MMKRLAWTLTVAGILYIVWWLASPLFLNQVVNETVPLNQQSVMYTGNFRDGDSFHKAKGEVTTVKSEQNLYLQFENFEVTNGPALHVYLKKNDTATSEGLDLGELKGNIGNQHYVLPEGIDLSAYNTVVVYCKAFHVDVGIADLMLKQGI